RTDPEAAAGRRHSGDRLAARGAGSGLVSSGGGGRGAAGTPWKSADGGALAEVVDSPSAGSGEDDRIENRTTRAFAAVAAFPTKSGSLTPSWSFKSCCRRVGATRSSWESFALTRFRSRDGTTKR